MTLTVGASPMLKSRLASGKHVPMELLQGRVAPVAPNGVLEIAESLLDAPEREHLRADILRIELLPIVGDLDQSSGNVVGLLGG